MQEILKRLQNEEINLDSENDEDAEDMLEEELDSDDEHNVPDLSRRLEQIDLNNSDALWECLTQDERQEFKSLIQTGDITKLLPQVEPWWEYKITSALIEEVNIEEQENKSKIVLDKSPKILSKIKLFNEISSKPPAACVSWNLVNVLAAYAFTYRYFNGDHRSYPHETTSILISISANLKSNANFDSESLAIESVSYECRSEGLMADAETSMSLKADVHSLFSGPGGKYKSNFYVLSALSEVHHILNLAKQKVSTEDDVTKNSEKSNFSKYFLEGDIGKQSKYLDKSRINVCIKKIEYYLSFANR